ncbi:MAG: hypothetical protein GEV12_15365 [Micromonosporaceae bacterium]|nr:hypothetical protein [Micromonosporaceae bacterium]
MSELTVEELPGEDPSRMVWVQAGAHGDEVDGVLALELFMTAARATPPPVTLRVARPANPTAHREGARCASTDGLDLNRCFPGDPTGSPTHRLGAELWSAVRTCDAVVDIHSSSLTLIGYPHVIVQAGDEPQHAAARAAARASGVPIVWRSTGAWLKGSLLHTATSAGLPTCLLDIGASRPWEPLPPLAPALRRVLRTLPLQTSLSSSSPPSPLPPLAADQLEIPDPQWLTAPVAGAQLTCRAPGEVVEAGAEVFVVRGTDGRHAAVTWPGPDRGLVVTVRAGRAVSADTPVASVAMVAGAATPGWTAAQRGAAGRQTDGQQD